MVVQKWEEGEIIGDAALRSENERFEKGKVTKSHDHTRRTFLGRAHNQCDVLSRVALEQHLTGFHVEDDVCLESDYFST